MPKKVKVASPHRAKSNKPHATRTERGYGVAHQACRSQILSDHVFCQVCKNDWASEAHHLRYGSDLTVNDYLAVCVPCHRRLERAKVEVE